MVNLGRERIVDVHQNIYTNEYTRLSHLDLALAEISEHNVRGDLAEVGVYQGEFAAVLNASMPDRRLYLFDTFEGFRAEQEELDRSEFGLRHSRDFSDTSVERVLARMPHPGMCVVRKGFFPETTAGLDEAAFCFVSLDADLYQPIRDGLEFFYDRMAPGGFIFVHDYNNSVFPGAKRAVLEFSASRQVPFVPISDVYGTAVFRR